MRNQNYGETLDQAEELRLLIDKLEKNVCLQLPQGVANKFVSAKNDLVNWVEEIEFILVQDYKA